MIAAKSEPVMMFPKTSVKIKPRWKSEESVKEEQQKKKKIKVSNSEVSHTTDVTVKEYVEHH